MEPNETIWRLQESLRLLQEQVAVSNKNNDIFFTIINGVIVYMFQCGFAFLEAGSVRSKNTTNILLKNLLDSCFAGLVYWAVGYAFAFGPHSNGFISYSGFFLGFVPATQFHLWFFHYVYAATASTIVSGAVAERLHFIAYIVYCIGLTGFIFPVVEHWVWQKDGWLNVNGFVDFAGSGVVHMLGGVCAFVGAYMLGPRIKVKTKDGEELPFLGHSVPLVALGGFILIFGFFCFNGGSVQAISGPGDGAAVAKCVVNTIISGSAAGVVVLIAVKIKQKRYSLLQTLNGTLCGMVAACAGCNHMYPWAGFLTGVFAGINYLNVVWIVEKLGVDDPLDATAVHFGGGSWGLMSVPFFHDQRGILLNFKTGHIGQSFKFLGWNILGMVMIAAWTAVWSFLIFYTLKLMKLLRVSEEVEIKGLDIFKHTEPAYPTAAYGHGWDQKWRQYPSFHMSGMNGHPGSRTDTPAAENPEVDWLRERKPDSTAPSFTGSERKDSDDHGKTNYGAI